jgi:hypothetical protein
MLYVVWHSNETFNNVEAVPAKQPSLVLDVQRIAMHKSII